MSYGSASRRDERRDGAIARFKESLQAYEVTLNKEQARAVGTGTMAAEKEKRISFLRGRIDQIKEFIRNTEANRGKGSSVL